VTSVVIVVLLSACGWLALKLTSANKDNAQLRIRIDSLKRQLLRAR
jgi:hypothetical protein